MNLRDAAEMALEALEAHADIGIKADKQIEALRQALAEEAMAHVWQQKEEQPWVKTYCGGKPNYCTPVDAVNISAERVHKTEKSIHVKEKNGG